MKYFVAFIAATLLSTTAPTLAIERNIVPSTPTVNSSAGTHAATQSKRMGHSVRKKRPVRQRCRTVVIAPPQGDATTTPTGLTYVITRRSKERQPLPGESVLVNYTGLLSSGVKFDSSLDRGQPLEFPLGKGRVIKGWDEGIAKLRVGEQATLIIPPQLGYGARGAGGVIPPNATLIFLVELVGIKEPAKVAP